MQSSPPTPTRRLRSSSIGFQSPFASASPQSNGHPSKRPLSSRRSSQYSLPSPSITRTILSLDKSGYFDLAGGSDRPPDPGNRNGLGNLADELADALDDEERDDDGLRGGGLDDWAKVNHHDQLKENEHPILKKGLQNLHAVPISPVHDVSLSTPKQPSCQRHGRNFDGSDHDNDSDLEVAHSPVLETCLAAVESLAYPSTAANGRDADEIIQRAADSLKNLGSQAGVENSLVR